jgi:GT2 family glycosyltransferase
VTGLPQVTAVVVTYNRAAKLATVLDGVLAQSRPVDRILVIDNASTDETGQVLARYAGEPRLAACRLSENTGGAGGFAEGMAQAYAAGADFVWLMDDDCYAQPDALAELLSGIERAEKVLAQPISFAGSMVRWTDGSLCIMNSPPASDDWGDLVVRGEAMTLTEVCSFVSMLIPAWAIERVGLPLRPYFIWFDDAEYARRLRRIGRGVQVHTSVVVHDLAENKAVNVTYVTPATLWKFRYGARNESSYRWHHGGKFGWLEFVLLTLVRLQRGRVPWRQRLVLLGQIGRGLSFDPVADPAPPRTAPIAPPSAPRR